MPLDLNSLRKAGVSKKLAQALIAGTASNPWKLRVDLPLTTMTDWTAGTGTWTADGTGMHQTNGAASNKRCMYSGQRLEQSPVVAEVEARVLSGTGGAGIVFRAGPTGDGNNCQAIDLRGGGANLTQVGLEIDANSAQGTYTLDAPIAFNTWFKLRVLASDVALSIWINDVLLGNPGCNWVGNGPFISLKANSPADLRNFKVWTLARPGE